MKRTLIALITIALSITLTVNWLNDTPAGCFGKAFSIGSTVCHQIPSHSYQRGEIQFPVCARCSGLYLGSFIGLAYYFSARRKMRALPARGYLIILALLFLLWAGDGINSFISDFLNRPFLYETTNATRLASGFGMGLVMATALATLFNLTAWNDSLNRPLLSSPWQVAGYFILSAAFGAGLLYSGEIFFTTLAYISITTVLAIVTLLYTIFWIITTRKEGQFTQWRSLALYLVAGFGTAMAQVTLLTMLRQWVLS